MKGLMTSGSGQCECVNFGMGSHPILELCRERRFGEAIEIARNEILRTPRDANGYRLMALVLELMGDRKAALSYRDKVVEISPEAAMSYYSRADLFYALQDYAAAIADFTRATELERDPLFRALYLLHRADCHRRLGSHDAAIADCAQIPDDFTFPGFLGQGDAGKHHLLAEIARERGGN
jgi:tetratricopeptide (TPR) repeat protein